MKVWVYTTEGDCHCPECGYVETLIQLYAAENIVQVYNMVNNYPVDKPYVKEMPDDDYFIKPLKPKRLEESDYGFEKRKAKWQEKLDKLKSEYRSPFELFELMVEEASFEANVDVPQLLLDLSF